MLETDVTVVDDIPLSSMPANMDQETEPLISNESVTVRSASASASQDDFKQGSKSGWYLFILTFGMGG